MNKVQLTLTSQEASLLCLRANQLGYGLTRFIKHLISKEAENVLTSANIPVVKMSAKAEKKAQIAHQEYEKGSVKIINTADELDQLI